MMVVMISYVVTLCKLFMTYDCCQSLPTSKTSVSVNTKHKYQNQNMSKETDTLFLLKAYNKVFPNTESILS